MFWHTSFSHVKNRDVLISTVAATLAGAITYLAHMAQWAAMFGGRGRDDEEGGSNPIAMILLAVLAPIAALLVQMAVSRSREFQADATGAKVAGRPWGLMKALEKLQDGEPADADGGRDTGDRPPVHREPPLSGATLMRLFSTHPPLEERSRPPSGDEGLARPTTRVIKRAGVAPGALSSSGLFSTM